MLVNSVTTWPMPCDLCVVCSAALVIHLHAVKWLTVFRTSLAATFLWCPLPHWRLYRLSWHVFSSTTIRYISLYWCNSLWIPALLENRLLVSALLDIYLRHFITSSLFRRVIPQLRNPSHIIDEMVMHCRFCVIIRIIASDLFSMCLWNHHYVLFGFHPPHKTCFVCFAHNHSGHLLLPLYTLKCAVLFCHVP